MIAYNVPGITLPTQVDRSRTARERPLGRAAVELPLLYQRHSTCRLFASGGRARHHNEEETSGLHRKNVIFNSNEFEISCVSHYDERVDAIGLHGKVGELRRCKLASGMDLERSRINVDE